MIIKNQKAQMQDLIFIVGPDGIADLEYCTVDGDSVVSSAGVYHAADMQVLARRQGGRIYCAKDTPAARVDAKKLAELRKSAILAGLFTGADDAGGMASRASWPLTVIALALVVALILK